jgi:hypothetical protein
MRRVPLLRRAAGRTRGGRAGGRRSRLPIPAEHGLLVLLAAALFFLKPQQLEQLRVIFDRLGAGDRSLKLFLGQEVKQFRILFDGPTSRRRRALGFLQGHQDHEFVVWLRIRLAAPFIVPAS